MMRRYDYDDDEFEAEVSVLLMRAAVWLLAVTACIGFWAWVCTQVYRIWSITNTGG